MKIFTILLIVTLVSSCEKQDDYNRILYDYNYRANFSFAIGTSFLNLHEMGTNLPFGWEDNPLLLAFPDTLLLRSNLPFEPQNWVTNGSEKIKQIVIKIRGYNEFPDRAELNFSLADSLNRSVFPTDSLIRIVISEAKFAEDSVPTEKGYFETFIILSEDRIKHISDKRYIQIRASIENKTKRNEQYSFYRNYKIEIGIGVQVQFDYNLKTLKN
ncbi:MAG: hypothetical protein N2662_09835 [Bacteroidales bacterium]|nr:hypothetical protein [Bacteroidales bacterium]